MFIYNHYVYSPVLLLLMRFTCLSLVVTTSIVRFGLIELQQAYARTWHVYAYVWSSDKYITASRVAGCGGRGLWTQNKGYNNVTLSSISHRLRLLLDCGYSVWCPTSYGPAMPKIIKKGKERTWWMIVTWVLTARLKPQVSTDSGHAPTYPGNTETCGHTQCPGCNFNSCL